jgi:hypothetical protein
MAVPTLSTGNGQHRSAIVIVSRSAVSGSNSPRPQLRAADSLRCRADQGDIELQHRIPGHHARNTFIPISQMRTDPQAAPATHAHSLDTVLETWNHPPLAEAERAALPFPHLLTSVEKQIVSHFDYASAFGRRSPSHFEILVLDPAAAELHGYDSALIVGTVPTRVASINPLLPV